MWLKILAFHDFFENKEKKRKEKLKTVYSIMSNHATFGGFCTYIHEVPRLTLNITNLGYLLKSQWKRLCYN